MARSLFGALLGLVLVWSLAGPPPVYGQQRLQHVQVLGVRQAPAPTSVCRLHPHTLDAAGAARAQQRAAALRRRLDQTPPQVTTSTSASPIQVRYDGAFLNNPEARAAFQRAVDTWSVSLEITQPIVVDARFDPLGLNVLGGAGPTTFYALGPIDRVPFAWFASALADQLLDTDLNQGAPDLVAVFSEDFTAWHFGTDPAPADRVDFESVVLHELGHGLGFLGGSNVGTGGRGEVGLLATSGDRLPVVYDLFTEDTTGTPLFDGFANPSQALGQALTSGAVVFDSPEVVAMQGQPVPLFAPTPYQGGSSYSHWDEAFYPPATDNALMTPQIGFAETLRVPGEATCALFESIGWTTRPAACINPQRFLGSINGQVFLDQERDGVRNGMDTPVPGFEVTLLDSMDQVVQQQTTDANGAYRFGVLEAGVYRVQFERPDSLAFSPLDQEEDDTVDSDADPASGRTALLTLMEAETRLSVDAGVFEPKLTLRGQAFFDADRDGTFDDREQAFRDLRIRLLNGLGQPLDSTLTDTRGFYQFRPGDAGTYQLEAVRPDTLEFSRAGRDSDVDPATGRTDVRTLGSTDLVIADIGVQPPPPVQIGGVAFLDRNANGIRDVEDLRLPGIGVELLRAGAVVRSLVTDSSGAYGIRNLATSVYTVQFIRPDSLQFTNPDQGLNDDRDSDADPATGRSNQLVVGPSSSFDNVDVGFVQERAAVTGRLFLDTDRDGLRTEADAALPDVPVWVTEVEPQPGNETSVRSDADGRYEITLLTPGTYTLTVELPDTLALTVPNAGPDDQDSDLDPETGVSDVFRLSPGQTATGPDAGVVLVPATLAGRAFFDADRNGLRATAEAPLVDRPVTLRDATGAEVRTTRTDTSGRYAFGGLEPGAYRVALTLPDTLAFTTLQAGADTLDSDIDPATGQTALLRLGAADSLAGIDVGAVVRLGRLSGRVFRDEAGLGIRDPATTQGIPDVDVRLLDEDGTELRTARTGIEGGTYRFEDLAAGSYRVQFVNPSPTTLAFSPRDQAADSLDSDVDPETGRTDVLTLGTSEVRDFVDAGLVPQRAQVQGRAFVDADRDGVQDVGEAGLPGLSVVLTRLTPAPETILGTVQTDAAGRYRFDGLTPGRYRLSALLPDTLGVSPRDVGADEAVDSDVDSLGTVAFDVQGTTTATFDIGVVPRLAAIAGLVFRDANLDGVRADEDPGVAGISVALLQDNVPLALLLTNSDGGYRFDGLGAGAYQVRVELPDTLVFSPPNQGADDTRDAEFDPETGRSPVLRLTAGETVNGVDAGVRGPSLVGVAPHPDLPAQVTLLGNYPNPFNPVTTVRFGLPRAGPAELTVYDLLGRVMERRTQAPYPAGYHDVQIDARDWPSGVYVYRLRTGGQVLSRTMLLLK
ncbi:MAG: SdrD B-like domain-containing protein [Bacteroidota bacterium]